MKWLLSLIVCFSLCSCSTTRGYWGDNTPAKDKFSPDSRNTNNNLLDSPDGSVPRGNGIQIGGYCY